MKRFVLVVLVSFIFVCAANAQIYLNTFTGASACPTNGNTPTMAANSSGTAATRNTITCSATANFFNSTTLNATSSVSATSYIEFSATADPGFVLNLTSLSFFRQGSNTAPNQIEVRYSTDGFGTSTIWGSEPLTATAGSVTTWDFADFSTLNNGTITFRIYPYGIQRCDLTGPAASSTGTFRVDDVTINGTVTAASNTIAITAINGAPFNLANCSDVASGSVDFTSTGVFNAGNTYTVQLSDAAGSFATPVNIGSITSVNNLGNIPININAPLASAAGYKIRIVSSNPIAPSAASSAFTITQNGYCATSATDYFRSATTGAWANLSTWESSNDSTNWIPATLIPGSTASHVVVRNPDSVYLTTNRNTINLTILSGAAFDAASFTMTASLRFNLLGTASFYQGGTVNPVPGVEQVLSANSNYHYNGTQAGISAALPEFGNLYWEPTPTGNSTMQNTTATAPFNNGLVIRGNMTVDIQGGTQREIRFATQSTISRTHTIDGDFNIISSNSIIVVQNGAPGSSTTGTVNIGGNLNITSGTFQGLSSTNFNSGFGIVNLAGNLNNSGGLVQTGLGTGTYTFNYVNAGLVTADAGVGNIFQNVTVASGKTVTLSSSKNVTGDVTLVSTNAYVDLGTNNLTVSGNVIGGSTSSYIRTASTGALILKTVDAAGKQFPVGHTKYNPITIQKGNDYDWTVNVNDNVTADIPRTTDGAVLLTWGITPSVNPPISGADIIFQFDSTLAGGQIGAEFNTPPNNTPNNVQVWHRKQGYWLASGTTVPVDPGPLGYVTAKALNALDFSPYGISRISLPLPIKLVNFSAIKISSGLAIINWELAACCSKDALFELEKSIDSRNFTLATSINGSETNKFYFYNDSRLGKGISYYRLKMTDADGSVKYSQVIAIVNDEKGFVITSIAPNPVQHTASLTISAAKQSSVDFKVYDMTGNLVKQWQSTVASGINVINMEVGALANGTYHVLASLAGDKTVFRFIKQ